MINFSAGAIDLNFLDQKTFLNQTKCPNTLKCHLGDLKISIIHRFYKGFATLRSFLDSVLIKMPSFPRCFQGFAKIAFPSLSQKLVLLMVFNSF